MADEDIRATVNDDHVRAALFAEYDRAHHSGVWMMSSEWRDELRRISRVTPPVPPVPETLFGLRIEVREDAGFPKLVQP